MKWNMLVGSLVLGASLCTPSFAGGLLDKLLGLKGSGCDSTCCDTGCAADPSCGCESACGSGCAADPSCGCESTPACGNGCGAAPSCGCESAPACGSGCGAAPSCGCESACGAAPSCGCETAPSCGCETSCCKPRRKPLLELLQAVECKKKSMFSKLSLCKKGCDTGCNTCEPTCGVDPSCGCESTPACGCGAAPSCGCEVAPSCDTGCGCAPKKCGLLAKLFKHKGKSCCDSACDACPTAGCSSCNSCGGSAPAPAAEASPMPPAPVVDPSAYLQSNRRVIQATSYVR